MKYAAKFCIATLVLSMLLAFTVFTLFAGGFLILPPKPNLFSLLVCLSCLLTAALLVGALPSDYMRLNSAFSCCGTLAVLGGCGLALTSLLTALSPVYSGTFFALGMALCFFFLGLLLGGIFCLLHCHFTHGQRMYRGGGSPLPGRFTFHAGYGEAEPEDRAEPYRRAGR